MSRVTLSSRKAKNALRWGPRRLAAVEAELFALRHRPADLVGAFVAAIEVGSGGAAPPLLHRAGVVLAEAVMSHPNDLAYHSHHHFAETVLVSGWMCGIARRMGRIDARDAALGVVAMVGHDYLHDGAPPGGGRLEARSAAATLEILAGMGLTDYDEAVMTAVILGTDPDLVQENAMRAAGEMKPGPLGPAVDLLRALANEADVFASFLPDMGPRQSELLAAEWHAGGHAQASVIRGFANRLAFLRLYSRLTPMALEMGVGELRARQFAAFTCGGGLLDIGGTPEEGAAALDALPPEDARERFTACLRDLDPRRP